MKFSMTFQVLEVRSIYRNGAVGDGRQRKFSISNEINRFDEQINVANDIVTERLTKTNIRAKKKTPNGRGEKNPKRIQMNKDHTQIKAK